MLLRSLVHMDMNFTDIDQRFTIFLQYVTKITINLLQKTYPVKMMSNQSLWRISLNINLF